MKIHKQGKKSTLLHPDLAEVISKIVDLPQDELPHYLANISTWMWPRSDLHSWVKVLNKFDEILKGFIEEYELDKLQLNPFTPRTKSVITEILRFETLLLDNSTNRKLFASYDRINSLLFSEDTDVIISALQLLLRPSQQYSSQPSASQTANVSNKRLISLSTRWPISRENGLEFLDLFDATKPKVDVPPEAATVSHTFYRKGDAAGTAPQSTQLLAPSELASSARSRAGGIPAPVTPGVSILAAASSDQAPSANTSGTITVHIPSLIDVDRRPVDILADEIEKHAIPNEEKFELLTRIRCAASLGTGPAGQKERENLVVIRLLAIAIFAHTMNEGEAQNSLFIYEPELVAHIAELIHPDRDISVDIQTAVIAALDGLSRYRSKTGEVLAAVNAGVTHGTLMGLMRRTVTHLADLNSSLTTDFAESLFSFVTFLASSPAGGSMIVGAGIVPLLVQFLQNRLPSRLQIISKMTTLIDVTLYGYGNAFVSFCNHRGVDAILQRIEFEVDVNIEESTLSDPMMYSSYGHLPFPRSLLLKHIMRTTHRMMQASGTSEGLRGLIDGPLPKAVKKIIQHRGLFGPAIFSIAINIMASFVHNEPTSLTILQESGVPDAFYNAIDKGLESANEVIAAVPSAIGALCLNQAGLDQLTSRPTIIPQMFSILTSDRHVKTLQDKENATYLGAAMDELIRHHPSLKEAVFSAIQGVMQRIEALGNAYPIPIAEAANYGLRAMPNDQDVEMDKEENVDAIAAEEGEPGPSASAESDAYVSTRKPENLDANAQSEDISVSHPIITYIDIACRFLEGLFQHTGHCREFISKSDGVNFLIKFYDLPSLPANFYATPAAQSVVSVIRAMAEAVPTPTLERLLEAVREALDDTRSIWQMGEESRRPTSHLDVAVGSDVVAINHKYRRLLTLHLRINLLSHVYSTVGYTHGRPTGTVLQIIGTGKGPSTIEDLAEMYRVFLWEGIVSKDDDPSKQLTVDVNLANVLTTSTVTPVDSSNKPGTTSPEPKAKLATSIKDDNAKAIRTLVQNLSKVTTPLFQAIVKLFLYSRRNPETATRGQAHEVAIHTTKVLIRHLEWRGSDDKVVSFTYTTLIIGLLAVLLFDERTTQNTLHTLLLVKLTSQGGLDLILSACKAYAEVVENVNPDPAARSAQETSEFSVATAGLGVALHLLHALSSSKPLLESGQTSLLVTRDKPKTDPSYFEPHYFLVKLRATVFPLLRSFWDATWLAKAPQDIAKLVVQGFLEIMAAEGEEATPGSNNFADLLGASSLFPPSSRRAPPAGPDENRIQQLCDMGFPRASAELALTRTHNNLSAATEYLLLHPFPLVAPGAGTVPQPALNEAAETDPDDEDPAGPGAGEPWFGQVTGDVDMEDASAAPDDESVDNVEPSVSEPLVVDERDWVDELKRAREAAVSDIASRVLWILGKFPELVFDVKKAFTGDKYQAQAVRTLISDHKSFTDPADISDDAALASRLRLLALVLSESSSPLALEDASAFATSFADKLRTLSGSGSTDDQPIATWLAPLLLSLEALLVLGEEFEPVTIPKADEPVVPAVPDLRNQHSQVRPIIFDFCYNFLSRSVPDRNELLACLRLLVLLTKSHNMATEFVSRGGLPLLLDRFKGAGNDGRGCQVHVILILRHIIEDRTVLESLMRRDLIVWFSQPRTRTTDVGTFLRHNSHVALRDPTVFIDSCKSVCMLSSSSPSGSNYSITLKSGASTPPQHGGASFDMPIVPLNHSGTAEETAGHEETLPTGQTVESLDKLLRYLISEVTRVGKNVAQASWSTESSENVPSNRPASDNNTAVIASTTSPATSTSSHSVVDYVYTCFLLQCLTELLSTYNPCKLAFTNYSRKRAAGASSKDSKPRAAVLQFILSEMISIGDMNASAMPTSMKKRMTLSVWAMSVVVALCMDPSVSSNIKDIPGEVIAARKLVLDVIAKSIRDVITGETLESRYSRLSALAELTFRLLSRASGPGSAKPTGDAHLHIPKIMLEKNFVALLTSTLGEIDLNFPNVRSLVTTLLRPLELLTKLAIKMGKATEKKPSSVVSESEASESHMSVDDEADDDDEPSGDDETPDIYRNSALGMYGGDMEDVVYPGRDDDMDDVEEEDEDGEIEYGDDEIGSDHTSETSQDDDDDRHADGGIDVISEASHSHPWDADSPEEEEEEDSVEGGDDEDEIDQDEALWEEDHEAVDDPLGEVVDRLEEEIELHQDEEEDEEEEAHQLALHDLGNLDVQLGESVPGEIASSWEVAAGDGSSDNGPSGFDFFPATQHARRGRLVDVDQYLQLFGRRRAADSVATDPSTHPLMTAAVRNGAGPAPQGPPHHHSRGSHRRSVRGPGIVANDPHGIPGGLARMIQDLIGEDGFQIVEQMMVRGGGSTEAILELRTNGGAPISVTQLVNPRNTHRSNPPGLTDSSQDPTRQVSEFTPVPTAQRWIDEGKMTQGRNAAERISTLVNFVVLALLPDARARDAAREAKQAKELKEREERAAREAEEMELQRQRDAEEMELQRQREAEEAEPQRQREAEEAELQRQRDMEAEATTQTTLAQQTVQSDTSLPVEAYPAESPSMPAIQRRPSGDDIDMADVQQDHVASASVPEEVESAPDETPQAPVTDTDSSAPHDTSNAEAAPSEPPARVTVLVHGSPVDITDTGIDPTFLEALPDDMRQEVIQQHMRERRAAEPVVRPEESQISPDFLDALPPEIRAEILQQEQDTLDRARRERGRPADPAAQQGGPSDIDSASFLASLEPSLRQTVLMDQDEGFLQTLPSALLAEASALLSEGWQRSDRQRTDIAVLPSAARKPVIVHESIQLLDKPGVATLVRMLFFPQVLRKSAMHKVLANLCENSKTRSDLFNLLLGVLQEGSVDVGAVDRSFSQLSFRPGKVHATTSKTPTKARADSYQSLAESSSSNPNLITQRCLEALAYIVNANESAAFYFLSEQDALSGGKRPSSRKGKGKEKPLATTHFPIVLLLTLLDRDSLLKSPAMMGMVAQLLATVTRPLAGLKESTVSAQPEASGSNTQPTVEATTSEPPVSQPAASDERTGAAIDRAETSEQAPPKPLDPTAKDPIVKLRSNPPQIPAVSLKPMANLLTTGECSAKTFQHTMSSIQNLSYLSEVKDVIAAELQSRAETLGDALYDDLRELTRVLSEASEESEVPAASLSKFSSASADQAKLLRLLKMLDFMYLPRSPANGEGATQSDASEGDAGQIHKIYETLRFDTLWRQLSDALDVIEQKSPLEHVATVLLPLIETLMVVSKHLGPKAQAPQSPRAAKTPLSPKIPVIGFTSVMTRAVSDDLFVAFTDSHRKLLNMMVRNNPSLMSGSFALLVNNPKVLDFDNKRNYFTQQLRRRPHNREHHTTIQLNVRRAHVFEDSYQYLHRKTGEQIKYGKLSIRFYEEEGVDAGGVTREWFQILARQMFNPDYALFQPCAGDKLTYQPNRASAINPDHLSFFKFVGRVIGKAIYDGRLLDAYFARSLYRQILGKPVDYRDVEWVDPEYYNSLCWILENDPTVLDMNFTVDADEFGLRRVIELKEGGIGVPVTQENKREFVQLSAQYRLLTSIKDQIDALLGGFYEIIPKDLVAIFNEQEVELLISGTPDIEIDEWRAATEYHGYSQTDPVIAWWWRALKSFNRDERAKVLSFATGTSRVPLGGFGELQGVQGVQKFSIHRAYGEPDRLPQAHTCFNQIDLPQFSSYEMLRTQLLLAINEGGEGFGFA